MVNENRFLNRGGGRGGGEGGEEKEKQREQEEQNQESEKGQGINNKRKESKRRKDEGMWRNWF